MSDSGPFEDVPIELIDTAAPVEPPGAQEVVQNHTRSNLALIVGALALAGVIFSLVRSPEPASEASERERPTVTELQAPLSVDNTPGVQNGNGPILGQVSGLSLMVGGSNTTFRILDLDTGDLVVSETVLSPQFMAGSTLIYVSDTMTWSSIPLDEVRPADPRDAEGRAFSPLGARARVVPADEQTVWLTWSRTDGGQEWQLIDVDTLGVLREITTPVEVRIPGGSEPFTGPEVVGSETGGVFELQADGTYVQVLDGVLIAVGAEEVLVRQCSPTLECALSWFSRSTWSRLDHPAPNADLATGRLVAGGLLLAGSEAQPALGAGLYHTETGVILRSLGPASLSGATVSPDGRWLVRRLLGRIEVVDVLGGRSTVVLNLSLGRGDSIIWLETP